MDPISMAISTRMVGDLSRVMMDSTAKINDLAQKMLKTGHELRLAGREMGKGQLLDMVA